MSKLAQPSFSDDDPAGRRSFAENRPEVVHNPPNPPSVLDCAGLWDNPGPQNRTETAQRQNPPRARGVEKAKNRGKMAEKSAELSTPVNLAAASQCERVLDGLCVNHNPDHVTTPHHKRQLAAFLRRLGVRNAPELVSRNLLYTLAADLVAERLDLDIAAGIDPMETAISPGAAIHGMIRKQAERLQTSPNLSAIPTPTSPDYAQTNQPSRFMEGR